MKNKKYLLQLGLAFVLLYAGISSFLHPSDWVGFVPVWVRHFGLTRLSVLHLHGGAEVVLGIWLLANRQVKFAAWLTTLDLAAIILVNGFSPAVFGTTFRDVGLFFASLYLSLA
jgi:uncharacterized membrane protein